MGKLLAFLDLFRKGSMVADPKLWKDRAALTMALAGVLMAAIQIAKAYGYEIPIDEDAATALAGGIAVLVGVLSTYTTSDKVGVLPPKPESGDGVQNGPGPAHASENDLSGGPN